MVLAISGGRGGVACCAFGIMLWRVTAFMFRGVASWRLCHRVSMDADDEVNALLRAAEAAESAARSAYLHFKS